MYFIAMGLIAMGGASTRPCSFYAPMAQVNSGVDA
jgi:hypothetical protein